MPSIKSVTLLFAAIVSNMACIASPTDSLSQRTDSTYRYSAEANAVFSEGAHAPFWLAANRYGLSSIERNNGYFRAGFFRPTDYKPRFAWGFGADFAVGYDLTSTFVIQQLYGTVRWRSLQLTIGSREHTDGILDERLSSGDMMLSSNARPIPQVRVEMPHFEPVPFTKKWMWFKGFLSYGMMTDGSWQHHYANLQPLGASRSTHRLYHSKGLLIRIGHEDKPLSFEGGLEMAAIFGGTIYIHSSRPPYSIDEVKMPSGWKAWAKVFIPTGGGDGTNKYLRGEEVNITGNHTGQWVAALKWDSPDKKWNARVYYNHFFDDHSMMFPFNYPWKDMLLGTEITLPRNPVATKIVYEYINTRDQSGPILWDKDELRPEQVSGNDDYYNHYLDVGWQHWGMGMGTPLCISPIYNSNHVLMFRHNRIKGHHIGVEGTPCPELSYRMLLTLFRSWGTYDYPTAEVAHSFNALWEVGYKPTRLPGWSTTLGIGLDAGALLGPSLGFSLSIKKTGWL